MFVKDPLNNDRGKPWKLPLLLTVHVFTNPKIEAVSVLIEIIYTYVYIGWA